MSLPTPEERRELLDAFAGLRVADVRDGLDWHMLHGYGSMAPDIRPLFRTVTCGIAKTTRYVPFEGPVPNMTPAEAREWIAWYDREVCTWPWLEELEDGDFVVIDQSGLNVGLMGSNNSLYGIQQGARGYVSDGGVRDTDEVILEGIPFWSASIAQARVEGRLRYESHDMPVSVGGVLVQPGDIVVADGDGVVVVPQDLALSVAEIARAELEADKAGRRALYDQLGMEHDDSVRSSRDGTV